MRKIEEEKTKSIPITELMVWDAYRKVKANRGSAGIDKVMKALDVHVDETWVKMYIRRWEVHLLFL